MSLIEVLVAILVAALGIMSMVAMQVNATKFTKTSEVRAQATLLIGDLADRMRANQQGFLAGNYAVNADYPDDGVFEAGDLTPPANTCKSTPGCTAPEMAAADLYDWRLRLVNTLPSGFARISTADTTAGENGADVWLAWLDPAGDTSFDNQATACPADLIPAPAATGGTKADPKPDAPSQSSKPVTPRCMHFRINI
jgi:type IV pilus assembly protein PilV